VIFCLLTLVALLWGHPATAQDARPVAAPAEQGTQAPAQPDPVPAAPTDTDALRAYLERNPVLHRLLSAEPDGVYPRLGGLMRGSGMAGGVGYRRRLGGGPRIDVAALGSIRRYVALSATARWVSAWQDRVALWSVLRWSDYPEEDFYGLGRDARRADRATYALRATRLDTRVTARLARWLDVAAGLDRAALAVARGEDASYPVVQDQFAAAALPGLEATPTFLVRSAGLTLHSPAHRAHPHRGAMVRAHLEQWDDQTSDRTGDAFSFTRLDLEGSYVQPLVPRHAVAVRIGGSAATPAAGQQVPFYLLPSLGGVETVRAFGDFRFRDARTLWLTAEYRWEVRPRVEVALFGDAGDARRTWRDLSARALKTGVGVGLRVDAGPSLQAGLDVATGGREGLRALFLFGPPR